MCCRKALFNVTSVFVNLSETMAEFGFLVSASLLPHAQKYHNHL